MRNFIMFPAAIVFLALSTPAFGDDWISAAERPHPETGGTGTAPAPVTPAAPIEAPVNVDPIEEEKEKVSINIGGGAPAAPVVVEKPSPLYAGLVTDLSVLVIPTPEGTFGNEDPMLLPGAQVGFGGTIGYRVDEAGHVFGDIYALMRFGTSATRNYESGVDLGGMVTDRLGVGGRALFGVRDLDYRNGTWDKRLHVFGAGPMVEYNFDSEGPVRTSILAFLTADYSTVVRDEDTFVSPTIGAELRVTIGDKSTNGH